MQHRRSRFNSHFPLFLALFTSLVATPTLASPMRLDVDATDAPRRLLHAELSIPVTSDELVIRYVEWTPGNHNASGPLQNVVNFVVTSENGELLDWHRDPIQDTRIIISDIPRGDAQVVVNLTYITNQPTTNSKSTDSYGEPTLGGINWNTVLFYPEHADKDELLIDATITLPDEWAIATPMPLARQSSNRHEYDDISLAELVDSPAIFGEHLVSVDLSTPVIRNHVLHGVAESRELLVLPETRVETLKRMHEQAAIIFGEYPNDQFDYLMFVADSIPSFGVEHHTCTYFSESDREWVDCEKPDGSNMSTMAHEYIHAWNGKLVSPKGLLTRNYHEPAVTDLLWVYEGLTSYMDDVLLVRSGLMTQAEYFDAITKNIVKYQLQTGRQWRPVLDTARGMRRLRAKSKSWAELRRRQDYYGEAALFWMHADATIRASTSGRKSLDNFCKLFFGHQSVLAGSPIEYTRADVVDALTQIDPSTDWDTMIVRRIESPAQRLKIDLPAALGYRLEYSGEPTDLQKKAEKKEKGLDLQTSLGFKVDKQGVITTLLLSSIGDEAKLAYDMTIVGVDEQEFSPDVLRDAVAASPSTGEISLLVKFGGRFLSRTLEYDGGLRYPRLVRLENATDHLTAIATPR